MAGISSPENIFHSPFSSAFLSTSGLLFIHDKSATFALPLRSPNLAKFTNQILLSNLEVVRIVVHNVVKHSSVSKLFPLCIVLYTQQRYVSYHGSTYSWRAGGENFKSCSSNQTGKDAVIFLVVVCIFWSALGIKLSVKAEPNEICGACPSGLSLLPQPDISSQQP